MEKTVNMAQRKQLQLPNFHPNKCTDKEPVEANIPSLYYFYRNICINLSVDYASDKCLLTSLFKITAVQCKTSFGLDMRPGFGPDL